jgi:hypothetical protein
VMAFGAATVTVAYFTAPPTVVLAANAAIGTARTATRASKQARYKTFFIIVPSFLLFTVSHLGYL